MDRLNKTATVITSLMKKAGPEGNWPIFIKPLLWSGKLHVFGDQLGDKEFQDKIIDWIIDLPGVCRVLKFVEQRRVHFHFHKQPKSRAGLSKQFVQA